MGPDWRFPTVLLYIVGFTLLVAGAFAVIRHFSKGVETILFYGLVSLTLIKIAIFQSTGLHLNFFLLSLLGELSWAEWQVILLKLLGYLPAFALVLLVGVLIARAARNKSFPVFHRFALLTGLGLCLLAELPISYFFLSGDPRATEVRRDLAYHYSPHPYYLRQLAEKIGWDMRGNAFAKSLATSKTDATDFSPIPLAPAANSPKILFVIADSLRAKDLRRDPSLMPSLTDENKAKLSLNFNSVSNCTHFSMYTMFYGRYPTGFSAARKRRTQAPFIAALRENGYDIRSFEGHSLDWYDTRSLTVGDETPVFTNKDDADMAAADSAAVSATINAINDAGDKPYFYLTYLYSSHWPYAAAGDVEDPQERYEAAHRQLNGLLARLKASIDKLPEANRPLLVFTSDHGEEIGDQFGHSSRLSDEQVRVPFFAYGPIKGTIPSAMIDVVPFLRAYVEGRSFSARKTPDIMMQCNYDYPSEFRVVSDLYDISFRLDDRVLSPLPGSTAKWVTPSQQLEAFRLLLDVIE